MVGKVLELINALNNGAEKLAKEVVNKYDTHYQQMEGYREEVLELRNYIFATDTRKTTNRKLPWKNSTTLPKICQIRDNLHANYLATLYPNDDWLTWIAQDQSGLDPEKAKAIKLYINNKLALSGFRDILSRMIYDYIDYGNVYASVEYVREYTEDADGNKIPAYVGPKIVRWSPFDIVFNPLAPSFDDTYKITRSLVSFGELERIIREEPENAAWAQLAIDKTKERRNTLAPYSRQEVAKAGGFSVDGFGDYSEYLQSGYVEVHEFEGDIYDQDTQQFLSRRLITVVDRMFVVRNEQIPSWLGQSSFTHCGWRYRPDNLIAMGPLANLVGMQYRIDHLENLKADVFDVIAAPLIKIKGNVEEFEYKPFEQVLLGDDGDIGFLSPDVAALQANTDIGFLMNMMEEMAGAPRQAIGQRTPGEKTAFEVQTLENNSNKMFIEKTLNFEMFIERLLNRFLESARRNLDGTDLVAVMDDDLGVQSFLSITKEDLRANGKLRPMGARNFQARAQMVQNYVGFRNAVGQDPGVMNHVSGKAEAQMLEGLLNLERFKLVRPNVRIAEQLESQALVNAGKQRLTQQQVTPAEQTPEDIQNG